MTKFAMFCAKPITWGAYFKLCGVAVVLGCANWFWLWLIFRSENR